MPPRLALPTGHRMLPRRRRTLAGVIALLAGLAVLASGCAGSPDARTVTPGEADRLAEAKYFNQRGGGRQVDITVPRTSGRTIVSASVDFTTDVGYGVIRTEGSTATDSQGLVQWNGEALAFRAVREPPEVQPAMPPASGWRARQLRVEGSPLDAALLLVFDLASEAPADPRSLREGGVRWVKSEEIRSERTEVFQAPRAADGTPSRLRYWVDSDGTMVKAEARMDVTQAPVVFTFDRARYVPVRPIRALAGPGGGRSG